MLGAIAEGPTLVTGFLASEDCLATLQVLRALGVECDQLDLNVIRVQGVGSQGLQVCLHALNMGNAGTAMRLFMGLLAGQRFSSTLIGDTSLMQRPMERAAEPLRIMGAQITTVDGKPPVHIQGAQKLCGIDYFTPVASAQVKSAVLLAGLMAKGMTRVTEPYPSRDHTERMLRGFGVCIDRVGTTVSLQGRQKLCGTSINVPGDFSSAAFFLVAGCIAVEGSLTLRNVGMNPTRTGLLDILWAMGADITVIFRDDRGPEPVADLCVKPSKLHGIKVPLALVPLAIDEFPVFFIAAACAQGESLLEGAKELRVKESDRLAVMSEGLHSLGVPHELLPDGMRLFGVPKKFHQGSGSPPVFTAGKIQSYGDHRVAMSFAVASLRAAGPIQICDTANVATSFPEFALLASSCGLGLEQLL